MYIHTCISSTLSTTTSPQPNFNMSTPYLLSLSAFKTAFKRLSSANQHATRLSPCLSITHTFLLPSINHRQQQVTPHLWSTHSRALSITNTHIRDHVYQIAIQRDGRSPKETTEAQFSGKGNHKESSGSSSCEADSTRKCYHRPKQMVWPSRVRDLGACWNNYPSTT